MSTADIAALADACALVVLVLAVITAAVVNPRGCRRHWRGGRADPVPRRGGEPVGEVIFGDTLFAPKDHAERVTPLSGSSEGTT
jgi:hypothetical protein